MNKWIKRIPRWTKNSITSDDCVHERTYSKSCHYEKIWCKQSQYRGVSQSCVHYMVTEKDMLKHRITFNYTFTHRQIHFFEIAARKNKTPKKSHSILLRTEFCGNDEHKCKIKFINEKKKTICKCNGQMK